MSTVWEQTIGVTHGRIPSANAVDGSYVYELGSSTLDQTMTFYGSGSFTSTLDDFTVPEGALLMTFHVRIVWPEQLKAGESWTFEVESGPAGDRELVYERTIHPQRKTLTSLVVTLPIRHVFGASGGIGFALRHA